MAKGATFKRTLVSFFIHRFVDVSKQNIVSYCSVHDEW